MTLAKWCASLHGPVLFLGAVVGCGSSPQGSPTVGNLFGDDGGGSLGAGPAGGSSGAGSAGGSFGDDGGGGRGNCADAARFVYLASDSNELFRFDPGHLQLSMIGI